MPNTIQDKDRKDHYDVIVVGAGGGGMTAALTAHEQGLSVLVIEKDAVYGGTTAVSGGGVWIPCNEQMAGLGIPDTEEEAMTYLRRLTRGEVPEARLRAYAHRAREMIAYVRDHFDVHFEAVRQYPDYFPDQPGGKRGARTMEPAVFDARQLGPLFDQQRPSYKGLMVMGRVAMTQVEGHTLLTRGRRWLWLTIKLMLRYWTDFAWRRHSARDRRQTMGQALVASLRHALAQQDIPLRLRCGMESLLEEDGRVVGVAVSGERGREALYAARGVILACGGFESNQKMREEFLPAPTQASWTAAPGCNVGDGIRAGRKLGARLGFMDLTWGAPTLSTPAGGPAAALCMERQLPGCVAVNKAGHRFCNEALPYTEFVYAMIAEQAKSGGGVPCWLVFDAAFRKNYPMGPLMPSSIKPDSRLPANWLGSVYWRADTLQELAARIGVDAAGLAESVAHMNQFAATGVDAEFNKGGNAFDRYYGDPHVSPNPCLAPIVKAPFYAIRMDAGELGTKGGLVADENARVLREDGSVIEGLYAIGNTSAALMGRTYAGPGATIGPALTFGYIAAMDVATRGVRRPEVVAVSA
ncbi:MAG TPA: FAD-dependent oxidoreductase [Nevskiaceae bacterium]|nr:FAD-dependent oxidoreductase [Nevskiaceae bacterium]